MLLFETEKLKLEFYQEQVLLIEKLSNNIVYKEEFYGNPNCGIIDSENKWAIIGGFHLTIWKPNAIKKYQNDSFQWIHALRVKNRNTIEILIDPWSKNSSIWELNTENLYLKKIRNFTEYTNKEFSEIITW